MTAFRTLIALSVATLATACASPGATSMSSTSPGMNHGGESMSMAVMETRMKAMKDMHQKMMDARTPAEKQALMPAHTKAMQDGMAMMKQMQSGKHGMGGMTGMTSMGEGKVMQSEMAKREQMMVHHSTMMQSMMDMMMQRMPASPATQ